MTEPQSVSPVSPPAPPEENLVGPRVFAALVDLLILGVVGVVFTVTLGRAESTSTGFQFRLEGLPFLLYLAVSLSYFALLEVLFHRTVGKVFLGLKVASSDERPLTVGRILVRNLLRVVDFLPFAYLLGIIVVAASQHHQRLGDMAAHTRIVRA